MDALSLRKDGGILTKEEIHEKRMANVKSTLNGGVLVVIVQNLVKRWSWLLKCRSMKEGAKLLMLQGLSETLSTRINQTRK